METVNVSSRVMIECTELLFGTVYTTSVMKIILRFGFVMLLLVNIIKDFQTRYLAAPSMYDRENQNPNLSIIGHRILPKLNLDLI